MLISAFAYGGIPGKAVKKAFVESEIYVSPPLLEEYRNVPLELENEGKIDHVQLKALIVGIAALVTQATIINPIKKLSLCRDPKDNMVLECCLAANGDILITGDKDLLEMEELPFGLLIMNPRDYLKGE